MTIRKNIPFLFPAFNFNQWKNRFLLINQHDNTKLTTVITPRIIKTIIKNIRNSLTKLVRIQIPLDLGSKISDQNSWSKNRTWKLMTPIQEGYFNPLLWWKQSLSSNSEIILSWNIDLNFRETQSAPKRSSEYISSHLEVPIYRLYTAAYSLLNL